jgi:protoglobin
MTSLSELRNKIFEQIPPEVHFTPEDVSVIGKHKEMLLSWEPEIISRHYDMLYAHPPTRQIFREGEREKLEGLLSSWWRRLINGPIDDDFWNWMTYVGLAHVLRKVKNPMMIAAWGHIANNVVLGIHQKEEAGRLRPEDAKALTIAFVKLGKIFTSLVAESYLTGLAEATGTNLALLETLASQEVGPIMERLRGELKAH